ncbi:MAG: alkaline phosphatase PhoX [Thermomicrobiales bacterium]
MSTIRRTIMRAGAPAAALVMAAASLGGVLAQDATPAAAGGFMTGERSFLVGADGVDIAFTPLLTSGDMVGEYQMAGVPDGLGAVVAGDKVIVMMNHELTTVDDENMSGARISRLVLDPKTGAVLEGSYVLDGTEEYERLCSAFLADAKVGFDAPLFLTGEESVDTKRGGMAIAVDPMTSTVTELPWLGHIAHENVIAVPGFDGKTVLIATDDDSMGSELYMYVAASPADVLAGKGQLYVFKAADAAGAQDVAKGGAELTGEFIPVDQKDNTDAATLQTAVTGAGAFRFIRVEDATYDRATPNTIYFNDTGDNEEPNLKADGSPINANGRVYSMTLDPADPTKVTSLKVMLDGDAGDDIKNPDNIEASASGLVIQEDRNGYNRAENSEDTGRIFHVDPATGALTMIARIDQSVGDGLVDAGDKAGSWESSGIIDVSDIYGEGAWLATVQAHSIKAAQFGGEDESGQLLLIQVK